MSNVIEFSTGKERKVLDKALKSFPSLPANESIMTTREIAALTQVAHKFVLERALEVFETAHVDPAHYWRDYRAGFKTIRKEMHLPKKMVMLAISGPWYSDKARSTVLKVFTVWEREDSIDIPF